MWILLNNQPVCVFNIKKVSGIIALTPELFYMDNNDIRKESVLSHIYSDAYKLYRQEVERALSLTEEDRKNPKDSPAVKAYEKALMGTKHIFGWYFKIQLDGGTTLYSSLYPSEEYAAQIRDSLLQTINKVTAELPKITI
jgi:hypothetical protein